MLNYKDLIDEIEEVKEVFSDYGELEINYVTELLKISDFEMALNLLKSLSLKYTEESFYQKILRNWMLIIYDIKRRGYLIDNTNKYTSFEYLLENKTLRIYQADNTLCNVDSYLKGKLILPDYIKVIEKECFCNTSLTEVELTNVLNIEARAFCMSNYLEKVIISKDIEEIPEACFWGCNHLKEVSFPEELRIIGDGAFRHCASLKEINLGEKVEEFKDFCFLGCTNLEKINILGKKINLIGRGAFSECENLKEFVIDEDDFISIGENAFSNCKNCTISVFSNNCNFYPNCFEGCKEIRKFDENGWYKFNRFPKII